nr:hypothetical protein [uncultured bacterium]
MLDARTNRHSHGSIADMAEAGIESGLSGSSKRRGNDHITCGVATGTQP